MLIFLKSNIYFFDDRLMIFNYRNGIQFKQPSAYFVLAGDYEISNCFILLADFNDFFLKFAYFFIHFSGNIAHMPAFLGEKISLFFPVLDIFLKPYVFHPLAFQARFYFFNNIKIIADILLYFTGKNVKIKHSMSK